MIIPNSKKKQKEHKQNSSQWWTYGVIIISIILLFIFLQPKVASTLFEQKREMLLNHYITEVKAEKMIDPKKYWEFREFYSPGHFLFEKDGLAQSVIDPFINTTPLPVAKKNLADPFLYFQSPYLKSLDSLTVNNSVDDFIQPQTLIKEKILVKNKDMLLYQYDREHLLLVFVLPESEMQKANGFFDYRKHDKELVAGKNWVNITLIQLR